MDTSLTGELTTHRSQTGIDSKYVDIQILIEIIEDLRYKLNFFGLPLDEPSNVFCNNQVVITSVINSGYILK